MAVEYDFGSGGFDIYFRVAALGSGQNLQVRCDSAFCEADIPLSTRRGTIQIARSSSYSTLSVLDSTGAVIEAFVTNFGNVALDLRITAHSNFISVYCNGHWIKTFWLRKVNHYENPRVWLLGSDGVQVTNVVFPELNDWRDAIFIDLEQTGLNAVSSIILSKPIDMWSRYDGTVNFAYNPERDTVDLTQWIRKWEEELVFNQQACSDGIVYFTDVAVVVDERYLEEYGFTTRLIRIPDVDYGVRVGRKTQDRARQSQKRCTVTLRFNPIVEFNDIAHVVTAFASQNKTIDEKFIVENLSISLDENSNKMVLAGRVYENA